MAKQYRHGGTNHPQYKAWAEMRRRCSNPNSHAYKWYGGRGISYEPAWDDFGVFINDMGPCPPGYSLDRIDNDAGYFKDNCRWADSKTQQRNRRDNVLWPAFGEEKTLEQWAEDPRCTISAVRLRGRLYDRKWPDVEWALTAPRHARNNVNENRNRPRNGHEPQEDMARQDDQPGHGGS